MVCVTKTEVQMRESTVEKTTQGDVYRVAEKYQALHKLGSEGGFLAPSVVGVDEARSMVILERIRGIRSIREHYREFMKKEADESGIASVFEHAGRVLAWIHLKLDCPNAYEWRPDGKFLHAITRYGLDGFALREEEMVQLHGDYGFANVFTRERVGGKPEIVIIDPCGDGYSTRHDWCRGPRYVDVGKMLLSIEGKVPLSWQFLVRRRDVRSLQNAFLKGYEDFCGVILDRTLCFSYAYALGACYFSSRYSLCGRQAAAIMYNRIWRGNFPLKRKLKWMVRTK